MNVRVQVNAEIVDVRNKTLALKKSPGEMRDKNSSGAVLQKIDAAGFDKTPDAQFLEADHKIS